ncbi:hypothetical protein ERJ75_001516000 [Trypanosoma vivax]|uniref:Uncharacterized protein n=1 Tax=Trypanosoma vivax (strain Y486) TaxID=1055687 RepID=F9WVB8_TRYVY|nr:hypothetical protein TRVL_09601 [Trypanosoma vivax]KAH8606449.1 hypothetical protein ERJ75_001516000 [Trypanosoma vivax]CCD21525.1 hypothetical protein, conserved in T. vivax [Trypanosoma vivax Y486]|eukprot:CCD21525.1 hypothetical protein, conserved in T. vivax [Trypanosoma vivax Y486]
MCAARASAAADVVLGYGATVMLENCSCGDAGCQSPQGDGFAVNWSALRAGLTLTGCGGGAGGSSGKCSTVGGEVNTLTGCNFSTTGAPEGNNHCGLSLPGPKNVYTLGNCDGECGGRKIKLNPSNSGGVGGAGGALCCGFISGENRTNEQQQESGQHGNSSNLSTSSREVESALKASSGGGPAASKSNGDSSHSTPRGPESSEHDGTSEKLSASNSTAASTKSDAQNEGAELGAMKVVVRCAAASLFISSAFF